jgi:DNA-binding NarL/FixJ family response regulator
MTEKTFVRTRVEITRETRRHLGIMAAESGATMSGIVENLIEEEWKASGHTAEYSARYAGTHTYKTHAQEREEFILKMHSEGQSIEQIAASLPRHLKTTLDGVKSIVQADADADLVESMRGAK